MQRFFLAAAALLAWSAVANLVLGEHLYVPRNLVLGGVLLFGALRTGFTPDELGLRADRTAAGAGWGVASAGVVAVVLGLAVVSADLLGPFSVLLADARAQLSEQELLRATLVRIPLGTALFEELLFRGLLLACLLRLVGPWRAVVASSVVFGLWHVPPTIVTLGLNGVSVATLAGMAAIAGAVAVTAVAGVLFCWLRLTSGSLLAPVLAHWATNALGLLAAAHSTGT